MREVSRAKVFARLIFIEIEQASGFFLMKKPPGGQLARVCELRSRSKRSQEPSIFGSSLS